MNAGADRGNRAILTLIGLLLVIGGGLGVAVSYGAFGVSRGKRPVLTPDVRDFGHRNGGWFWPVIAIAAVILALLALRWLLAQLGTDRVRELSLSPPPGGGGSTTLQAGALTSALTDEVESYHGVRHASARLTRDPRNPDLILTVAVNERADLGALRKRIEEQAVAHARQATGLRSLPVRLQMQLTSGADRRVR